MNDSRLEPYWLGRGRDFDDEEEYEDNRDDCDDIAFSKEFFEKILGEEK